MIRSLVFSALALAAGSALSQDANQTTAPASDAPAVAAAPAQQSPAAAPVAAAPVAPVAPAQPSLPPLEKIDHVVGTGEVAVTGKTVSVHYTGWLYKPLATKQRGRKFDSSVDRGQPLEFPLGAGRVIKGWDQGVEGMKVGGKRTLIIPSHLAYGKKGAGGVIPSDADLIFDVELVGVK